MVAREKACAEEGEAMRRCRAPGSTKRFSRGNLCKVTSVRLLYVRRIHQGTMTSTLHALLNIVLDVLKDHNSDELSRPSHPHRG